MTILTVDGLRSATQDKITSDESIAYAESAIADAEGVVIELACGRSLDDWDANTIPSGILAIIKRIAASLYKNPQQRTSYTGPDGLNYNGGAVRLLSDSDRELCGRFDPQKTHVGSMRLAVASWMRNPTEAEIAAEALL